MTIHHDKLAYGRLSSLKEDTEEEKLKSMARRLSESKGAEPTGSPAADDETEEETGTGEDSDDPGVKKV